MEEPFNNDTIKQLRASNREDISALRKQDRDAVLRQRRLTLGEVEALTSDITLEQFKELVLKFKGKRVTMDLLKAVKKCICSPSWSDALMKSDGAFNALVGILVGRDAQMQLEAAACLTNLACGSHKAAMRIAKAAGPYFVSFLGSGSHYLQDQCAWAAGNIACDCFQCFSLLKSQGVVPALLANLVSSETDVIQSTVFALSACTKYEDDDLLYLVEPVTMNLLLKLLSQENLLRSIHKDTAFVLSNILFLAAKHNIEISSSMAESIITCFCNSVSESRIDKSVTVPLGRCLGYLGQRDSTSQYLAQHQRFNESVLKIFNSNCQVLAVEAAWILTNISRYLDTTSLVMYLNLIFEIVDLTNEKDPAIIHILYLLCTWGSRSEVVQTELCKPEFISKIEPRLNSGEEYVEKSAQLFLRRWKVL